MKIYAAKEKPASTVLLRCSCNYDLIVDEGTSFFIHLGHWRVNKTTGRVTARCPRCPAERVIKQGSGVAQEDTKDGAVCRSVLASLVG